MKWQECDLLMQFFRDTGVYEESPGRWVAEHRIYHLFEGGLAMTTITLKENPDYDVETVHTPLPGEDEGQLFARSLREHTAEIKRRTETLREKGLAAIRNNIGRN